ncbi:MAG: RidA family protein [Chloroflexota bacterium]
MARREVIELEGFAHGNPIPVAVKIGNMVYSGAVAGTDEQGVTPADPDAQIGQVFKNVQRIVEKAGGTTADIAKLDVKLRDMSHRPVVNKHWLAMFPDEHDRPARHTQQADLPGTLLIQVEVVAVLP